MNAVNDRFFHPMKRLALVFFLAIAANGQNVDDAQFARIKAAFQQHLDQAVSKAKMPGATAAFVLPDGRQASFAAGVRSLETKVPIRPTDPMLAGSIGKTFVSALTLQLIGEGKLDLDSKISRWLGAEPWFSKLPNSGDITLRMLLNHSSGVPNHVDEKSFFKTAMKEAARDIKYAELLTFILGKPPLFPAGKGYSYTDTNYILIGLIVEKVTGNTLYNEISARLLKPAGLGQTYPSNKNETPIVTGYNENEPVVKNGRFIVNPQWEWAGGGFGSTAGDLSLWASKLYGGRVLSKDLFEQMISSTSTGDGKNYGLGVEMHKTKLGISYRHDGEFPGYLSDMRFYVDHRIAVAVQTNADEPARVSTFLSPDDFAQIIVEEISNRKLSADQIGQLERTAEIWLALVDAGRYAESWNDLSSQLKAKFTVDSWPKALEPLLKQVGKLNRRTFKSAMSLVPGKADVDFESSFAKQRQVTETVTMLFEDDGKWHVSGYSIH